MITFVIKSCIGSGADSRLIELTMEGTIEGYTSAQILKELRKALEYPRFELEQDEVETICDYYALVLKVVEPKHRVHIIVEDPEDNETLECAVEAEEDYIVSGNHHLLDPKRYNSMRIVGAREMLKGFTDNDQHPKYGVKRFQTCNWVYHF